MSGDIRDAKRAHQLVWGLPDGLRDQLRPAVAALWRGLQTANLNHFRADHPRCSRSKYPDPNEVGLTRSRTLEDSNSKLTAHFTQLAVYLARATARLVGGFAFLRPGEAGYDDWDNAKGEFVTAVSTAVNVARQSDPNIAVEMLTWGEGAHVYQF